MSSTDPSASPPRPLFPFPALHVRWLRQEWRRAALRHAFGEVDALMRTPEPAVSGRPVDLYARVTRAFVENMPADVRPPRTFSVRPWPQAETPQRGRSAEFWLLSCRVFHDDTVRADAEVIACAVGTLRLMGLTEQHVKVRISHRSAVRSLLLRRAVDQERLDDWFPLLHRAGKTSNDDFISNAVELGMDSKTAVDVLRVLNLSTPFETPTTQLFLSEQAGGRGPEYFKALFTELRAMGVADWCVLNLGIVRGGSHYTGMVFEVHDAGGRGRALVGGGRSELPGNPPVQSVGFDMGDAALLDLLAGSGLLPDARDTAEAVGARPEIFITSTDDAEALEMLTPTVASLRRAGLSVLAATEPAPDLAAADTAARAAIGACSPRHAVLLEATDAGVVARVRDLDRSLTHAEPLPLDQLRAFFNR